MTLLATYSARAEGAPSTHRMVQVELADGMVAPAVEITLADGWHTYWELPLDVGLPPQVRVNGELVQLLFPQPTRMEEDGLATLGYTGTVVLPLYAFPAPPFKLQLNYAVCADICIPIEAELPSNELAQPVKMPLVAFRNEDPPLRIEQDGAVLKVSYDGQENALYALAVGRDYAVQGKAAEGALVFDFTSQKAAARAATTELLLYAYEAEKAAVYKVAP